LNLASRPQNTEARRLKSQIQNTGARSEEVKNYSEFWLLSLEFFYNFERLDKLRNIELDKVLQIHHPDEIKK